MQSLTKILIRGVLVVLAVGWLLWAAEPVLFSLPELLFFPIALFGPLLTGIALRYLNRPWVWAAAPWVAAALFHLGWDWVVANEDQAFHLVLAILMAVLAALGAAIGRIAFRRSGTMSEIGS